MEDELKQELVVKENTINELEGELSSLQDDFDEAVSILTDIATMVKNYR